MQILYIETPNLCGVLCDRSFLTICGPGVKIFMLIPWATGSSFFSLTSAAAVAEGACQPFVHMGLQPDLLSHVALKPSSLAFLARAETAASTFLGLCNLPLGT